MKKGRETYFCDNCGARLNEEDMYCTNCGEKRVIRSNNSREYKNKKGFNIIAIIIIGFVLIAVSCISIISIKYKRSENQQKVEEKQTEVESNILEDAGEDVTQGFNDQDVSLPDQSELLNEVQRKYSQAAVSYEGHVYAIFNYKSEGLETWNECREFCENMDGHLAVINTEEENEFVYRFVRDSGLHVAAFGYTDQYEEGNWEWVDGTISDYENWAEGQPNNGKNNHNNEEENYAEFYKERNDGTWNDAPFGANTYRFICEWE